jgi:hypothetical protein
MLTTQDELNPLVQDKSIQQANRASCLHILRIKTYRRRSKTVGRKVTVRDARIYMRAKHRHPGFYLVWTEHATCAILLCCQFHIDVSFVPNWVYYFHLHKGKFIASPTFEKYDTGVRRRDRRHYAPFRLAWPYTTCDTTAMRWRYHRSDMTRASHCFMFFIRRRRHVCYPVDDDTEEDGKQADHSAL